MVRAAWTLLVALSLALATAASTTEPSSAIASSPWAPSTAPPLAPVDVAAITAIVEDARASSAATSGALALGVIRDGAVLRAAWGSDGGAPITTASTFRIASITKTFTAIVAMQLAQRGRFDLDADVRQYVPEYPAKPWPITARALLTHTSGIPHYTSPRDALTRAPLSTSEALSIFAARDLAFTPGARFQYSSFGYNLAGRALEAASGQSYDALVHERVIAPLGMTSTRLERTREAGDVTGFRVADCPRTDAACVPQLVSSERIDISSRFASGGMRSNVDDLLRYARALLARELVDDASWRRMTTPTVTRDLRQADYGLGFAVYPMRGHNIVAHAGGQPETSTLLLLAPDHDVAIVLLANVEGQGAELHRLAAAMIEVMLDGGTHARELYADDVADELAFDGMRRILSYGLAVGAHAPSTRQHDDDVARAFRALGPLLSRTKLRAQPDVAKRALADAYHPASGRVTSLVGGEMVRVLLTTTSTTVAELRARGPLAFFVAYADACDATRRCRHALPSELVADARRLDAAWRATPPELAALRPEHVVDHVEGLRALVGTPVHPSFRADLTRVAARLAAAGEVDAASRVRVLNAALHPRSEARPPEVPAPPARTSTTASARP